ncbi:MAG TPA: hypothetical protein VGS08_05335 [Candidatus Saccharimonadales bacterium]|nr:hypothetical protein [Candidatus Saccharimonadales bacterium]
MTLSILAIGLGLFGYAFYARGILQGKIKPHAFTWFVWGVLTAIAFVAQISSGGGPGAWATGFTALCSFAFAIVGLSESSRVLIAKSDWAFFFLSLLAIPMWRITGNPLWAILIITVTDAIAFIPTFRKAYHHPETENKWTYTLSGLKFLVSLFALQSFNWTTALYPASLVLADLVFVMMLVWRKQVRSNPAPKRALI